MDLRTSLNSEQAIQVVSQTSLLPIDNSVNLPYSLQVDVYIQAFQREFFELNKIQLDRASPSDQPVVHPPLVAPELGSPHLVESSRHREHFCASLFEGRKSAAVTTPLNSNKGNLSKAREELVCV